MSSKRDDDNDDSGSGNNNNNNAAPNSSSNNPSAAAAAAGNNANDKDDDSSSFGWMQLFSQSQQQQPGWVNPQLHQAAALLHSLDESLKCFLCKRLYDIPCSIQPCHHSFCNGCIRQALDQQLDKELRCPICQTPLDTGLDLSKCLVLNRSFEETARHYKTLRPVLKQALTIQQQQQPPPLSYSSAAASPRTKSHGSLTTTTARKRSLDGTAAAASQVSNNTMDPNNLAKNKPQFASSSWKTSKQNPWIREQFTIEWNDAKQTWCFHCKHCHHVTLRSKEKKWNVSKLTEHILQKCAAATDAMRAEAHSHTQGAKRARREGKDVHMVVEGLHM